MKKLFTLLTFSSLFLGQQALACSCQQWSSAAEMVTQYDAVFLAIPEDDSIIVSQNGSETTISTKFSVVRSYKDASVKEVSIFSWKDTGGNCGVGMKKDDGLYVIFAYKNEDGKFEMNSCTVSSVSADYGLDFLKELNKL